MVPIPDATQAAEITLSERLLPIAGGWRAPERFRGIDIVARYTFDHLARQRPPCTAPPIVLGSDIVLGGLKVVYRATKDAVPAIAT